MCRDSLFSQLRGTAALRGERYASSVRELPADLLAVARERLCDLTRDERLLELLAEEFVRWVERRHRG